MKRNERWESGKVGEVRGNEGTESRGIKGE